MPYCYSVDGDYFEGVYSYIREAKKDAIAEAKERESSTYWIGELSPNKIADYIDSKSILIDVIEQMDWDDRNVPDDALALMTDKDYDALSKELIKVFNSFIRRTNKINLGEYVTNVKQYSTPEEEPCDSPMFSTQK